MSLFAPKTILALAAILLCGGIAAAQIPVELFGGHQRATIDIMFFKFFKQKTGANSRWLFFNRNRASIDYRMTDEAYLPLFGFTEAVSYNHPQLKGFAPVAVGQVLNGGVFPKAGIQYAHVRKSLTFFTWVVSETFPQPDVDLFLLVRYTPKISGNLHLFTQLESIQVFPTDTSSPFQFTQRLRLGAKIQEWQLGVGADLAQRGRGDFSATQNVGGFLRHEF